MAKLVIDYSADEVEGMLLDKIMSDYGVKTRRTLYQTEEPVRIDVTWHPDRSCTVKVGPEEPKVYQPSFTITGRLPNGTADADAEPTSSSD